MANTTAIKRRIGSVKNTRQITKAMQLVAASRMRKAQDAAHTSRLYNQMARELLTRLGQLTEVNEQPLFAQRPIKARLLVVVTSDRGLAGAYNSNALRSYVAELKADKTAGIKSYTIAVGQKAAQMVGRLADTEVVGVYRHLPQDLQVHHLQPLVREATKLFTNQKVDKVDVIYTHFYSTVNQQPKTLHLFPAGFTETEVSAELRLAEFEPSLEAVLSSTAKKLIEAQLWQSLLESVASEESMRMLAMKNATDNANDIVDDLTLAYNNARQASITQELAEITGGAEAMSE
jgi:F-type H+-transporting ATPase subunit gamma